jgi:hypothetical protein
VTRRLGRIATGVPTRTMFASLVMSSLVMRTQPWLTDDPTDPGAFVPWIAIWPMPLPNLCSTVEKAATLSW